MVSEIVPILSRANLFVHSLGGAESLVLRAYDGISAATEEKTGHLKEKQG